jgi:predicted Zn-dependent protease
MKKIFAILIVALLFYACSNDSDNIEVQPVNKSLNRQATGSSANDLLSDDKFKSIRIELVYVEGLEPSQGAINNFVSFLTNLTFKPIGITVEKRSISSPGKDIYTIEEIADIEREQRKHYNSNDEIAVWVLFLDGKSENDEGNTVVLGSAYWNTSFVIYEETVQNLSDSPFETNRTLLESTVINHEFGHILGLTNLGSPMQTEHEDEENPKHCNVESCLMYWESEVSRGRFNLLGMNNPPELDAQCLADLKANGGR